VTAPDGSAPVLRVVRGDASPEELAALLAVLAVAAGRDVAGGAGNRGHSASEAAASAWQSRGASARHPLPHGADAWRASSLPH
jgi:hypothetical protein